MASAACWGMAFLEKKGNDHCVLYAGPSTLCLLDGRLGRRGLVPAHGNAIGLAHALDLPLRLDRAHFVQPAQQLRRVQVGVTPQRAEIRRVSDQRGRGRRFQCRLPGIGICDDLDVVVIGPPRGRRFRGRMPEIIRNDQP